MQKHQRTARYCLDIQQQMKLQKNFQKEIKKFVCEYCHKEYFHKEHVKRHQSSCVEYHTYIKTIQLNVRLEEKDNQISGLKEEIAKLQEQLNKLAERAIDKPTRVGGQDVIYQTLLPLTFEHIQEHSQFLTLDHVKDGVKGYVRYAMGDPFKNRVICTDKARKKLKYKDEEGRIIEDSEGISLAQKFFSAIDERNQALINDAYSEINTRIQTIVNTGMAHREDITELLTMASKLQNLGMDCQSIANGNETDLRKDFIHRLTKLL